MSYKLFLDDVETAPEGWVQARSYDEFVDIIQTRGVPSVISFDYDLGKDEFGNSLKTGVDCAKYLIDNKFGINKFIIHSNDSIGRHDIPAVLKSLNEILKFKEFIKIK